MLKPTLYTTLLALKNSSPNPQRAATIFTTEPPSKIVDAYIKHRNLQVVFELKITEPVSTELFLLQFGIEVIPDERIREKYRITKRWGTSCELVIFTTPLVFSFILASRPACANAICIIEILAKCGIHSAVPLWKAETFKKAGIERFLQLEDTVKINAISQSIRTKEKIIERKLAHKRYSRFVPFGYNLAPSGSIEINKSALAIIAGIAYLKHQKHLSLRDIQERLYLNNIPSPAGKGVWNVSTISDVINRYENDYKPIIEELGIAPLNI